MKGRFAKRQLKTPGVVQKKTASNYFKPPPAHLENFCVLQFVLDEFSLFLVILWFSSSFDYFCCCSKY